MMRGVFGEIPSRRKQRNDRDRPAGSGKITRCDKTVATVVAGDAQNGDRASGPMRTHRIADRAAGRFHEINPTRPPFFRELVGLVRLTRCEEGGLAGRFCSCSTHQSNVPPLRSAQKRQFPRETIAQANV